MKKHLLLSIPLFVILICSIQCNNTKHNTSKKHPEPSFDPEQDILVRQDPQNQTYKPAFSDAVLTKSLLKADPALASVEKIFVRPSVTDHVYLVFHATDTIGNSVKKALFLRQVSKGIFKVENGDWVKDPIVHVCEGVCCNNCQFKELDNKFHGCDCQQQCPTANEDLPGYCNHVIGKKANMILAKL